MSIAYALSLLFLAACIAVTIVSVSSAAYDLIRLSKSLDQFLKHRRI